MLLKENQSEDLERAGTFIHYPSRPSPHDSLLPSFHDPPPLFYLQLAATER